MLYTLLIHAVVGQLSSLVDTLSKESSDIKKTMKEMEERFFNTSPGQSSSASPESSDPTETPRQRPRKTMSYSTELSVSHACLYN